MAGDKEIFEKRLVLNIRVSEGTSKKGRCQKNVSEVFDRLKVGKLASLYSFMMPPIVILRADIS